MLEFLGWLFGLTPKKKKEKKKKDYCLFDNCHRQCTCRAVTEAPCNARGSICLSHDNEGDDEENR